MFNPHPHAHILIDELIKNEMSYFCIAPGSRSTPFAHALAHLKNINNFIHFDERALAFHALGYAKASNQAAPIFTTSGSALANLFPAVVEAYQDQVPLIIFSADRPYELHNCGANQTINQTDFFHRYSLFSKDLPLYEQSMPANYLRSIVCQALSFAKKGPVHLNCQFREPFLEYKKKSAPLFFPSLEKHKKDVKTRSILNHTVPLNPNQKGVLYCARSLDESGFQAVLNLAKQLNWPIACDILSAGRFQSSENHIKHLDWILKHSKIHLDCFIQFEGPITSKEATDSLGNFPDLDYKIVSKNDRLTDPNRLMHTHYPVDAEAFCKSIEITQTVKGSSWLNHLKKIDVSIKKTLPPFLEKESEPGFVAKLFEQAKNGDLFFIGASLSIRQTALFAPQSKNLQLFSNRGASGIDGNLATAIGISQAKQKPITVLMGDLTFLYDLGSLAQLKDVHSKVTLVVLNNKGGAIFSLLPIAQETQIFERYFQTSHPYTFEKIAEQFQLCYHPCSTYEEFDQALKTPSSHQLIEINLPQTPSTKTYQNILSAIKACCIQNNTEIQTTP